MLSIHAHSTVEEASEALFPFIVRPENWVPLEGLSRNRGVRPGENAAYQRAVGPLRICASVDVTAELSVYLRVAFRAPQLTPLQAADHLADFLKHFVPLLPHAEWEVHVDGKRWVHFIHRWVGSPLQA